MDRSQKEASVAEIRAALEKAGTVVVAHYSGLTVDEITTLRRSVRSGGGTFKVAKNRLVRRAIEGTPFAGLDGLLKGPTALAFSLDPVFAAKAVTAFAKQNDKLVVLGGVFSGQTLDKSGVEMLASMPSLDELRAKIVGLLVAPATRIAGVLQAPGGQVARVISAHAAK